MCFPGAAAGAPTFDLDRTRNSVMDGATSLCSYRQVADMPALTAAITIGPASPFYVQSNRRNRSRLHPLQVRARTGRIDTKQQKSSPGDSTLELDAQNVRGGHLNGSLGYGVEAQKQTTDGWWISLHCRLRWSARARRLSSIDDGSHANTDTVDSFRSSFDSSKDRSMGI